MEAFYKGSDFANIRPVERKFMVCKLVVTYWEGGEDLVDSRGTKGRVLAVEVLGHTSLVPDWGDRGTSA